MTDALVYVSNEKFSPLPAVMVEAFRTDTGAVLAADPGDPTATPPVPAGNSTALSSVSGQAVFSKLVTTELDPTDPDGKATRKIPFFFRPRVTRNSGGQNSQRTLGVVRLHQIS